MKNSVKLVSLAAACTVAAPVSALAADPALDDGPDAFGFGGFYGGVGLGVISGEVNGDCCDYGAGTGIYGTGFAGFNFIYDNYIIGIEGSGIWGDKPGV